MNSKSTDLFNGNTDGGEAYGREYGEAYKNEEREEKNRRRRESTRQRRAERDRVHAALYMSTNEIMDATGYSRRLIHWCLCRPDRVQRVGWGKRFYYRRVRVEKRFGIETVGEQFGYRRN